MFNICAHKDTQYLTHQAYISLSGLILIISAQWENKSPDYLGGGI